jgi:hypothetical protein
MSPEGSLPEAKRATLQLPEDELTIVNNLMTVASNEEAWSVMLQWGNNDFTKTNRLNRGVLIEVTQILSKTNVKNRVRPPLTPSEVDDVLARFSADESNDWITGIQKGLTDKNWADLIAHRASQFTSQWSLTLSPRDSETPS